MTDLDQLDIMRRAITALGLGQCAPEDLVAEAKASSSRSGQDRGTIADQRARIKELESALRDLGVNPGGDLQGEVRAINNRAAGDSAAAQHDLDCAVRERDRAIDDARTATARIKEMEAKIASNIADLAACAMRIAELEAIIEATHKVFDGKISAWHLGTTNTRLTLIERAALAVEPDTLTNTEREALRERIADLERDLAAKDAALKTANAALNRICELACAPVPACPEDAVDAVCSLISECEIAKGEAAEVGQVTAALDDAGAPKAYRLDDDGEREIPTPERIRLLGEHVHTLRAQLREVSDATNYLNALIEAHNALDSLGAPRLADGCVLSLAARIRSLPR